MKPSFSITAIKVLEQASGHDIVWLETTLPAASAPFHGTESLTFTVARGGGVEYVRKNFGKEPDEVVKAPAHKYEFSKR